MVMALAALVAAAAVVPSALGVSGGNTITTIAGTGTPGFVGDGGQATSAQLNYPTSVAVDLQGNRFIADSSNHRVREVTADGNIKTVAGTGTKGFSGDGGQATSAQLNYPYSLDVDGQGNLFIADTSNHRVREVTADGNIKTVAGTGTGGFSGDGGQATSAQLYYPYDVAVDAQGNLFIADESNHRVREVTADGNIKTVAGTGTGGFSGDGGQATSAQLYYPYGVAVDGQGNLYIADESNHRVRKVSNGVITTVAGTGTKGFSGDGGQATSAQLYSPEDVAVDGQGNLYIADESNHRVRKVSNGVITTVAGTGTKGFSGDGGPALSAQLNSPEGAALDKQGNLYIADTYNHRIRKVENKPPTASIDASPVSGQAPLNVTFTGSGSDPDGSVVSYSWAFGDNTTASGASVSHLYGSAGTFHVTLTVTDDSGATASASRDVTVSAPASPPPPPPPSVKPKPKPVKPRLASSAASFGKAQAGSEFSVSFTVTNKATGRGVRGSLTCAAKLAGKKLAATRKSTSSSGEAICVWKLPRSSSGDTFVGVISETFRGVRTSRSFSTKVV